MEAFTFDFFLEENKLTAFQVLLVLYNSAIKLMCRYQHIFLFI